MIRILAGKLGFAIGSFLVVPFGPRLSIRPLLGRRLNRRMACALHHGAGAPVACETLLARFNRPCSVGLVGAVDTAVLLNSSRIAGCARSEGTFVGVGRASADGAAASQKFSSGEIGRLLASKYVSCQMSSGLSDVQALVGLRDSHQRQA